MTTTEMIERLELFARGYEDDGVALEAGVAAHRPEYDRLWALPAAEATHRRLLELHHQVVEVGKTARSYRENAEVLRQAAAHLRVAYLLPDGRERTDR